MRFLILLVPFTILSIWVRAAILSTYRDIFVNHTFIEQVSRTEWYHLLILLFATGIPLWLTTVYYGFKKWKQVLSFTEVFYLFMSYFSFMIMLIGHMTRPIFWGSFLAIHIIFLILIIRFCHLPRED